MKTIITHFYNEEYLLPWWLNHHKNLFDHGVLIDYGSTDRSVEIIKEICPTWEIVKSRNDVFDAELCDREVEDIEKNIEGWRIALTITEFLLGDINSLCTDTLERTQYLIPTLLFAEFDPEKDLDTNKELWDQIKMGCGYYSRSLHNYNDIEYAWSRHYLEHRANDKAMIFKYAYALIGRKMIDRRKTMFSKFSDRDKENNRGTTINYLPDDSLKSWYETYVNHTLVDCSQDISKFLILTPKPAKPDYTVYLYSNKPHKFFPMAESIKPEILNYFDGSLVYNFSKIINSCVEQCPTEKVILVCDKVLPKAHQVQKIVNALDLGYAFASVHRFGFYGFKKELFRKIGMLDERFIPGGCEDIDFFLRIKEANLSVYMVDDCDYSYGPSSWDNNKARSHFKNKWKECGDTILQKLLPEENYNYNLGPSVPTKFLEWKDSFIRYSHRNADLINLFNKDIVSYRSKIIAV